MTMTREKTIALNGSHDCSFTFVDADGNLRIYEYERFTRKRYCAFSKAFDHVLYGSNDQDRDRFIKFLKTRLKDTDIRHILYHDLFPQDFDYLRSQFPNVEFVYCNHHESHAYSSVHGSGMDRCLILSIDGGGHDNGQLTMTNLFMYENGQLRLLDKPGIDFGTPYRFSSFYISEIPSPGDGDLSESGKFMGLSAYGRVRQEWVAPFRSFYGHINLHRLSHDLGLPHQRKSLQGQAAWDLAATSQKVFEDLLFEYITPFIETHRADVIVTGGCGLNVLFNQKLYSYLKDRGMRIYVPPNPNDCGLSYGMWISRFRDEGKGEMVFSGMEVLDPGNLPRLGIGRRSEILDLNSVLSGLREGMIYGVVDGNSEVGPRALGHRSIICNPAIGDMKDILNMKVKFREWFRPFAPVCLAEDKDKYFIDASDSPYMSYAPEVRHEYRALLPAITHVDGSSRLQTVQGHGLFGDILRAMKENGMVPVLLNTSFNIKGRPILTTIEDAFQVLDETQLDALIYEGRVYYKKQSAMT
jgi:carbamoyltransferase